MGRVPYVLLLVTGLLLGKVEATCDVLGECNTIAVQSSSNQISVSGLAVEFFLQNITFINGTALVASDNSYNNTSLMSFVSGTQYIIHYGNDTNSCCYNITTKPLSVMQPQANNVTTSSVSLRWIKPDEYQSSYSYRVQTNLTSPSTMISNITMTSESATIGSLEAGETYTFLVFTRAADNVTESDPVSLTTCTVDTCSQSYRVQTNFTSAMIKNTKVSNESVNITDLTPGETYTFLIYTRAADNVTESDPVLLTTCTVPGQAVGITVNNSMSVNSLVVKWTAPTGKVSNYTVTITGDVNRTLQTTSTQITFSDLLPGRNYTVTVQTVSGNCTNTAPSVTEATYPSPPGNITFITIGTNTITLSWGEAVNMAGVAKSYNITYYWNASCPITVSNNTSNITLQSLKSGTNYTISVVRVGVQGYQSTPVSGSIFTKPLFVKQPQVIFVTTTSVSFNWSKPDEFQSSYSYRVQTNFTSAMIKNTTVISDLLPGRNYTVTVQTVSGNCTNTAPSVTEATYPTPPANITFTDGIESSSIALFWGEPINMTGVNKLYSITYWNSSSSVNWTVTSDTPIVTLKNLTSGTNYTVSVVTVGVLGYQSTPVIGCKFTTPDQVYGITVNNNKSVDSLVVNWMGPAGQVSYYVVNITGDVNSTQQISSLSVTFSGLLPGRNYTITVQTVSGDRTNTAQPVTEATYPTAPGNIIFTNIGTNTITLSWGEPINMTSVMKSYSITYWNSSSSVNWTVPSNTPYVTLENMTSGTNYTVSVVTVGVRGYLSTPVISYVFTKPMPVISLQNTSSTTSSVALIWRKSFEYQSSYSYRVQTNVTSPSAVVKNMTVTSESANITDLSAGETYTFIVYTRAADIVTESDPVSITSCTIPEQAVGVTVGNQNSFNSLVVSWTAPAGKVSYYIVSITGDVSKTLQSTSTQVTFTGLLPGRNYTITVLTVSYDCTNTAPPVTEATYPTPPGTITFTDVRTNTITLSWGEPMNMNVMKTYRISYWNSSSSVALTETSNTPSITLQNLTSGTNYTISVVTVGVRGYQSTPVKTSIFTKPMLVTSLNSPSLTTTSVALNWNKPNEYQRNYTYKVQTYLTSSSTLVKNTTVTSESSNITDLQVGLKYTFIVYTIAIDNTTESDPVSYTTDTLPIVPGIVIVKPVASYDHIDITFNLFSTANGPVKTYALIVTSDKDVTLANEMLIKTYNDFKSQNSVAYVALVTNVSTSRWHLRDIGTQTVRIGDGSEQKPYVNGPLDAVTSYRIAVAGFTDLKYNTDGAIDRTRSHYTITSFSDPITTPQVTGVIIGAVLGTILGVLGVAVVGGFIWWRRRNGGKLIKIDKDKAVPFKNVSDKKKSLVMSTSSYLKHFDKQIADSNLGFIEEYEKLGPVGKNLSKTAAEQPENREKNRYTNVLPYDLSRVTLSSNGNSTDDYINANFIPGYINTKEFIASQGPLPKTINDFWRMIWEKDVRVLIMLTKCVEVGKVKCEEYWPSRSSRTFGNLSVSLKNESILPDWTIRDFLVTDIQTKQNKQLRHFHFTAWPDHGVPNTTDDLIRFRNLIRDYTAVHSPPSSPILVHCSAGVGRTGTLIALDRIIKQIEAEDKVDVYGVVYDLRMNRGLMVQTESQYIFLNKCALDVIKTRKTQNTDSIYQNYDIYQNVSSIYQNISKTDI
ncbi:receptor-type tyrosine-protein phosphatase eta-like [Pyxicephalus adspersus]|uniref:receptor-type tyrosine-protein phosphatase eta-like n=1 Tax=Pyxicephalus adspersus TaxID=30357 RepID=UPI003B58C0B0